MQCEETTNSKELEVTVMSGELDAVNDEKNDLPLINAEDTAQQDFTKLIQDGNDTLVASTYEGEYLRWHYRLFHISWKRLRLLALLGIIPRKLALLRYPPYPCCIAAKMSRIPTRTKRTDAGNVTEL